MDDLIYGGTAGLFDITEYATAFVFDADTEGVDATIQTFQPRYSAQFGDLTSLNHGQWSPSLTTSLGIFVFHNPDDKTGTLEDHLGPMAAEAWPLQFSEAEAFIDAHRGSNDKVSSKSSERMKAIITATGQFNHPGDPMSVILGRNGLPKQVFEASSLSRELAEFLTRPPWRA